MWSRVPVAPCCLCSSRRPVILSQPKGQKQEQHGQLMEQERNTMEVAFTRCDRAVANPEVMEKIGDIPVDCLRRIILSEYGFWLVGGMANCFFHA